MITIVALGDSTTAGTPLFQSPIEAPPNGRGDERSQFAYWLMQKHPDWQVLNRGVNGERTRSDRRALRSRRARRDSRGVVIIIAGVNDVYQGRTRRVGHRRSSARCTTALSPRASRSSPDRSCRTTPRRRSRTRACTRSTRGSRHRRAPISGWCSWTHARPSPSEHDPDQLAGSPDGLHPNVDGYHHMADALEPWIAKLSIGDR